MIVVLENQDNIATTLNEAQKLTGFVNRQIHKLSLTNSDLNIAILDLDVVIRALQAVRQELYIEMYNAERGEHETQS